MRWVLILLLVATPVMAQEPPDPAPAVLVAVPSFTGTLPDGTPVIGIIVVPAENVLNQSADWQAFQQAWPTHYRLSESPAATTPDGEAEVETEDE